MDGAAQQAQLGDASYQLTRETLVLEAVAHDGNDLLVDEFRDRVTHQPLVFAEHGADVAEIERGRVHGRGRCRFGMWPTCGLSWTERITAQATDEPLGTPRAKPTILSVSG